MNKIEALKFVARALIGAGTANVTNSIIRNNVEPANMLQTVSIVLTSMTIGSMASAATTSHADAMIDQLVELWEASPSTETTSPTE